MYPSSGFPVMRMFCREQQIWQQFQRFVLKMLQVADSAVVSSPWTQPLHTQQDIRWFPGTWFSGVILFLADWMFCRCFLSCLSLLHGYTSDPSQQGVRSFAKYASQKFFDSILSSEKILRVDLDLFVSRSDEESLVNTTCPIPFSVYFGEHSHNH